MKKLAVVGRDDSALVHAKILGQAADDRICTGKNFPDDRPYAFIRISIFLLDQALCIFHNARAIYD